MFTNERKYHFVGEFFLTRSRLLNEVFQPKDDITNWFFLKIKDRQLGFIYKIREPDTAQYNQPFIGDLSFLMNETAQKIIELGKVYEILRGEEAIGHVKIVNFLD